MPSNDEERLDRELIELLNELRVALPGVQVLFAFLLAVPFTQRFEQVNGAEKWAFFGSFLCTTVASVLLIAPSAYHRLRWREHDKEHMLETANRLTIAGTVFLALAMTGVVFLTTDLLFNAAAAIPVTVVSALAFGWFWYGLALTRRLRD
jgi:heme/copper-type cytochrome/quinol oxidase subunit 2